MLLRDKGKETEMRELVENMLLEVGIFPNLVGFVYIPEAITMLIKEPRIKIVAMYEIIAKRHHVSMSRVERGIRYAVQKCNHDKFVDMGKDISNSEFLYYIALQIERRIRDEQK